MTAHATPEDQTRARTVPLLSRPGAGGTNPHLYHLRQAWTTRCQPFLSCSSSSFAAL